MILQATAFLHVPDLKVALDRMTKILGFEVKFQVSGYAYLECGNVGIRIVEEPGRRPPPPGAARMSVYVDVSDVDGLYAELLPRLRTLPEDEVHPPFNQPWNQREFHVRLPDGNWLAYGQPRVRRPDDSDPDEELED